VTTVLDLHGVSRDYRGLRPLRIERLTVAAGGHVALLGLDHVSAEVFINLVTGATLPDAGHVHVFGRPTSDIADSADWLATVDRFGIVSERAVLLESLTVIQNLAMPFSLEIEPPSDDVRAQAEGLAAEVGLAEGVWARPVAELDPAGHARVRLGRALALNPAVLLLEHVSAGLDAAAAGLLAAEVRATAARRGAAIVAVTADEAFARAIARRVLRWEPATGRLTEQRGWFGRWLG
jgi:predicted ABC-type transport system involved in lysophospholipase L1 biosynthesis ATPase subunit